jgi:hypothetical protein
MSVRGHSGREVKLAKVKVTTEEGGMGEMRTDSKYVQDVDS